MSIGDHPVQTDLMEIGSLQLQHLMNTSPIDLVGCLPDFLGSSIRSSKSSFDELFAVLVQKIERWQMCAGRDLNKFRKTVPDLCRRQCPKEGKIEESVDWRMICPKSIFVVTIVDCNFDGHRGVDQANDGSWDPDKVGVSAVCCTGKSKEK